MLYLINFVVETWVWAHLSICQTFNALNMCH